MSTSEHYATYRYPCPHGTGEYIDEWWIPDHPYNPRPYRQGTSCTCAECERLYEADFDDGTVLLRERTEMERRRAADRMVSTARDRLGPIERTLAQQAIAHLQRQTGPARYRLAVQMLGFASEREAMDFADRRRVPTWVPAALGDTGRRSNAASYFGQSATWAPLHHEYVRARDARSALGEARVCHILRR